ncbi:neural cell adhesion molecule 1-like isoform X2 [Macrobrachium rosenbergii]|uniref:neural cell adhesion molecule 1-like isoform X2 n=1 Tax=Macrobrachium rosenbergii TaxID=79674 RepID=UPI0034D4D418
MQTEEKIKDNMIIISVFVLLLPAIYSLEIKKVSAVEGKTASLPCDFHHPPDDSVFLILWFNDNLTTPIYSYDMRPGAGRTHWVDETVLGSRATLDVDVTPAKLVVSDIRASDAGLYKCRVDFRRQPTKTTRVNLSVIVPPKTVFVVSKEGPVTSVVGPYREGDTASLTCISKGGWPRPRVLWYQDGRLIDDQMDEDPEEGNIVEEASAHSKPLAISNTFLQGPPPTRRPMRVSRNIDLQPPKNRILKGSKKHPNSANFSVQNTLTLGPFTRADLKKLVTCESTNTNLTSAKSAPVMIDMNLEPLGVQLYGPDEPLSYGKQYEAVCEVTGSRPPPTITWWKATVRVQGARETTTSDGNMTTSMLTITPKPSDDGTTMTCRAENLATNTVLEQSLPLTVYYVPETFVSLGSNLDPRNIKEGDDVYFECSIKANPRSYKVVWKHNGRELQHNITSGIIVSNQSLVLQKVTRRHAGRYTCTASNIEGDGTADPVTLDIKYAPVCAPGQVITYGVARNEDAEVTCRVAANPPAEDFKWTFNNTADTIDVPPGRFTSTPTYSIITYTPMTELDYGTLLCWAENAIGQQNLPCVFHIVPAGKPDPPANCSVSNQTSNSFIVACQKGFDGGLHQVFFLRVAQPGTQGHTLTGAQPVFQVEQLSPDTTYRLQVWAANDKGSSPSLHLQGFTTHPPSHHHTAHVVAEVREGSSSDGSSSSSGGNSKDNGSSDFSLIGSEVGGVPALVSIGAGAGVLILLIFLVAVLLRHRLRRPVVPPPTHPPAHSVLPSSPQPILKNVHDISHTCAEREMQNDPRYAHLDLEEGGQHQVMLATPKSRLVPTVYATLDTRHAHSRVTFDLRQAQSQVSIGHDLGYPQRSSGMGPSGHNPRGDPACDLGYGQHMAHTHIPDLGRSLLDEDPTPETPLVGKRESSV